MGKVDSSNTLPGTGTIRSRLSAVGAAIIRWFDTSAAGQIAEGVDPTRIDWIRCIPFIGMHLACFAVLWVGWSWIAVAVAVSLYLVRMFSITAFYHRYFSHRAFSTSRFMQFLFAIWGASAVQRGPLWWAAHHRHHHRHSDEEDDRHSPHQDGFYWSHMGWMLVKSNFPTDLKRVRDLAAFPELRFLDRFDTLVPVLLASSLFGLGWSLGVCLPQLETSGSQMLVWGFFISTVVLFHATCTINSLAHKFGRKRYPTRDESRNSFLLALLTLGEGWHNNHHYVPGTVRQGFRWWEIDITFYVLCLFSWLGLVWDLRMLPPQLQREQH